MATPWDILTTPALLATVRAYALTQLPPYPASADQLRAVAGDVADVAPDGWDIEVCPEGFRALTATCTCHFSALAYQGPDLPVYGAALLAGDDQVWLDYFPPGFLLGPNHPKLTWPITLSLLDGRNAPPP